MARPSNVELRKIKIAISLTCAVFGAIHLLAPGINIDAVTLGLVALGLLPWFQPLVKSLELPGGLKIELQDVKDATDKISGVDPVPSRSPVPDAPDEDGSLAIMAKVAEQDPNLALVGLRIEVEKLLVEIARASGISMDRRGVGSLLGELSRRDIIPRATATGLKEFIDLGNRAAHGATVTREAATWALDLAPQLLGVLSALRTKAIEPVRITGTISKAEILAAYTEQSAIQVRYPKSFATPPNVTVGFYGFMEDEMSSGSLQRVQEDENGFTLKVVSMPTAHSVSNWVVKWKATGPAEV